MKGIPMFLLSLLPCLSISKQINKSPWEGALLVVHSGVGPWHCPSDSCFHSILKIISNIIIAIITIAIIIIIAITIPITHLSQGRQGDPKVQTQDSAQCHSNRSAIGACRRRLRKAFLPSCILCISWVIFVHIRPDTSHLYVTVAAKKVLFLVPSWILPVFRYPHCFVMESLLF